MNYLFANLLVAWLQQVNAFSMHSDKDLTQWIVDTRAISEVMKLSSQRCFVCLLVYRGTSNHRKIHCRKH